MGRFRKIDSRIWNDEKVSQLSRDGKLAFLFVLTHPSMTSLGAMRGTIEGLAIEIGMSMKAFQEPFQVGLLKSDKKSHYIEAPNFLKYNQPESPNVVKSWVVALDLIPECSLKRELIQRLKPFWEGLPEAFLEHFRKGMPNQEQEQEQEQEKSSAPVRATVSSDEEFWESLKVSPAYRHVNFEIENGKMDAWLALPQNKHRMKTRKFILNWLNKVEKPVTRASPSSEAGCQARVQYGMQLKPCGKLVVGYAGKRPVCQGHKEEHDARRNDAGPPVGSPDGASSTRSGAVGAVV